MNTIRTLLVVALLAASTHPLFVSAAEKERKESASKGFTAADFESHLADLKKKLPSKDFQIVVQKPFVVIGDESLANVKDWAQGTVAWAVDRLKKEYFAKDPDHIIDIWIFKDKESYEKNTLAVFAEKPHTPFGYYSYRHRALIMNIDTGSGTLVHEIVHPYVAANFPDCPSWFNEGLASLYEACREKNGRIWGQTNWRLRGLHGAIGDKSLISFEKLCATTSHEFYETDRGANYAQARYLCYYLQEKGLLRQFYREFRASVKKDPTGYQTLCRILGEPDMEEFQEEWQAYVLKLRN